VGTDQEGWGLINKYPSDETISFNLKQSTPWKNTQSCVQSQESVDLRHYDWVSYRQSTGACYLHTGTV
jgi:hypothetical protein